MCVQGNHLGSSVRSIKTQFVKILCLINGSPGKLSGLCFRFCAVRISFQKSTQKMKKLFMAVDYHDRQKERS